jgi:hypothetical protein
MRDKLIAKLKDKAGDSKSSPAMVDAKKGMLESLIKHMSMMGGDHLKRVSAMSDSDKGLQHGQVDPKSLMGQRGNPGTHDEFKETPESEQAESPAEEQAEVEAGAESPEDHEMEAGPSLSPENEDAIDKQIAELMAKKSSLRK